MNFQSPGAIFFKLGPVTIRWYGVMICLGFICTMVAALRMARRWGLDADKFGNCILCVFIGGLVGARLYYVSLLWDYFSQHPMEIGATWLGGLSIHGGIIGGVLTALIYCWATKEPFLKYCDVMGATVPIAQAVGRWGNFFNSELFGRPVPDTFPVKWFIPPEMRTMKYLNNSYFHPTFLYESAWNLLLFVLLYFFLADRLRKIPGLTFCVYVIGYSIGRAIIEPIRTDAILVVQGMPVPFLASLVGIVLGTMALIILLVLDKKKSKQSS